MDDLVKKGKIYRAIMPKEKGISTTLLSWLIVFSLLLIPGIILLLFRNNGGFACLLVDLILLAFLPVMMRDEKAKQAYMARRYAHFTDDDFLNLEQQLYHAEMLYNTFYMLEEYIFIPGEGMLVSYLEIQSIRTVQLPNNGVTVYFLCQDGEFGVSVFDWMNYLHHSASFERLLREKKQLCLEKNQRQHEKRLRERQSHTADMPQI